MLETGQIPGTQVSIFIGFVQLLSCGGLSVTPMDCSTPGIQDT